MNRAINAAIALLVLTHVAFAAEPAKSSSTPGQDKGAGNAVVVGAPDISFGPDGSVSSLILEQNGTNLVDTKNPGLGFYLETATPSGIKQLRFSRVRREGDTLVLGRLINGQEAPLPRLTFEVHRHPRYLALKLVRVEGFPTNQTVLRLEIRCKSGVVMRGLDYMMHTDRQDAVVQAVWNYLWHRNPKDPLGSIALYPTGEPDKEDEALLDVWVNEDLPKPAIKEPFTRERARRWLEEFARLYSDQTRMTIAAQSPEELYAVTKVAERAGVTHVKLHTDTWRGEYWPVTQSHVYINPKVFPNGVEDLKKYTDYLRQRGMFLEIHTTSAGIGPRDPKRIAGHVSRELASWGNGAVEAAISATDTTIRFRPNPGTDFPLVGSSIAGQRSNLDGFFVPSFMRIGDEIVRVGNFQDTDKPVWTLTNCTRGIGATSAAAHAGGDEMVGLISAYGQNFMPDVDSPLLEEMAQEYADLANAIGLGRLEYDALEIHAYPKWGCYKYPYLVAQRLDHPVVSGTSGGTVAPSNIEFKFHRYKHLNSVEGLCPSSITMETTFRPATTQIEYNLSLANGVARGANKLGVSKSQAMFGINQALLDGHGLSGTFLDDFRRWKAVAKLATPEQRKALGEAMAAPPKGPRTLVNPESVRGFMGAGIRETTDAYEVIPTRFLTRTTDAPAMVGVESAAQSPRQFIQPGEMLQFNNPYAAQPVNFIIRVLSETAQSSNTNKSGKTENGQAEVDQYLTGVASAARPGAAATTPSASNDSTTTAKPKAAISLQPKATEVQNQRHATFTQSGDGVIVAAENLRDQELWQPDELPRWAKSVAMPGRGLSMDVTGDNSGAVLVLQLEDGRGTRDYIIKIDFTGKRTITIPTGEVSWADGRWGRRSGTEWFGYEKLNAVSMGFGFIPAKTSPQVKVANLQLLADRPSKLVNPVITVGTGQLQITGEVETGQILQYTGGDTAGVYDANWHLLRLLPATRREYVMPAGPTTVSVRVADGAPHPWLETQFFVESQPIRVLKQMQSSK